MKRIPPPNYTQTPNIVLDNMADMGNAELRVVLAITRKTFGWQKRIDRISLSQLEELTGLSRQGVIDGTAKAIDNGWIEKTKCGDSFEYTLVVKPVDQEEGSQASRLEVVKPVDSQVVKPVDTQKKELKKKETIGEKPPRPKDELFDSLAEICQIDPKTAGSTIAKVKNILAEAGYSAADVKAFGAWWWGWKDRTTPPRVWDVKERIGIVRQTKPKTAEQTIKQTGGWNMVTLNK